MPGLMIRVPGTFDNPDLPILRNDAILPETGALMLIDLAHAETADFDLVYGAAITNLAADLAATVTGDDAASLHAELRFNSISEAGTAKGKIERTSKGGLHTILTDESLSTGEGTVVFLPQGIIDYIVANVNNDYYVSIWFYLTRPTDATAGWSAASFSATPNSSNLLYSLGGNGTVFPTGANKIGGVLDPATLREVDGGVPGPVFGNVAVSAYTGTPTLTGSSARNNFKFWGVGNVNPFASGTTYPSAILYRAYLEDLTVSGRTYAQVTALDQQLYEAAVETSGGRFYGDSYTDPDTYVAP